MELYEVNYITPQGRKWELWHPGPPEGPFMERDSLTGMVGEAEDVLLSSPHSPGHILDSQNVKAMTGSMTVCVVASPAESVPQLVSKFRQGWSRRVPGTLEIKVPALGRFITPVRLASSIAPLAGDPNDDPLVRLQVEMVADDGLWWQPRFKGTGQVHVSNPGDVPINPRIRWSGPGGEVTLPSGATFSLPATEQTRIVYLDAAQSFAVTDTAGAVDWDLTITQAPYILPEPVPPGQKRTFTVPDSAVLEWDVGFFDPWKG